MKYPWKCIFNIELCMAVYLLDDFWLLIQVSSFLNRRAPRGPPFCQKSAPANVREQNRTLYKIGPHKIGPVLSFPHASSAAALQPSNALWRGFELAHGVNSTKFASVCCCEACGCGYGCGFSCGVCLRRPLVTLGLCWF